MYINAYVLSVAEENKDKYIHVAQLFRDIAIDYGVVEIVENWEVDVPDGELTDFRKAVKAESGEKIVVSWVIWPDKETGMKAHEAMFKDPRMSEIKEMPFNGKHMILGGFEPIVQYRKDD